MRRFGIGRRDGNSRSSFYTRIKLASLDFKSFQRVIWLWLGASGYQNLRTLGRGKQRGRGSVGPDFLVQVGDDGLDVAVQIRHWKSPLTKRAVDELRGILLRDHIPAGMIVCPTRISKAARFAAADYTGRPIRVIGIESLADSMEALDLVSPAFFRSIQALNLGYDQAPGRIRPSGQAIDFALPPLEPDPHIRLVVLALVLLVALFVWLLRGALQ